MVFQQSWRRSHMLSTELLFLHSAVQLIPNISIGLRLGHCGGQIICLFSAYLSCSCHNMNLVFHQIGLSSVYHPYLVTTQLIGSNILRRKEINKAYLFIEMHSRWLPLETGWENAKRVQCCHQGKGWLLWTISNIKYILICWKLFGLLQYSMCYFIVYVFTITLQCIK